jgi:hypothetical protein
MLRRVSHRGNLIPYRCRGNHFSMIQIHPSLSTSWTRPLCISALVVTANCSAGVTTLNENFSTQMQSNYSTWLVNCFQGTADIRTLDSSDTLIVYSGPYDLNWNGDPVLDSALANNGSNRSTNILFHNGYSWNRFIGDFSCAWDSNATGDVTFVFSNSLTFETTSNTITMSGLSGNLLHLEFNLAHQFDRVAINGNFVVMDNLVVSIPAPSAVSVVVLAGLTTSGRRRR